MGKRTSASYGTLLVLAGAAAAPSSRCTPTGTGAGDGGVVDDAGALDGASPVDAGGSAPEGGAITDAAAPFDASDADGPDAALGLDSGDASPEASADASGDATTNDAASDASVDASPPVVDSGNASSNEWAAWPMPNPPWSGLPHPQSYDLGTDGITVDRVTGLVWQRDTGLLSAGDYGVDVDTAAPSYCAALRTGGYSDWRVPTYLELISILDLTRVPAIDTSAFTTSSGFTQLVSSTRILQGSYVRVGATYLGDSSGPTPSRGGASFFADTASTHIDAGPGVRIQGPDSVRCVRGGPTPPWPGTPRYTVSDGTVRDNGTKLTWHQAPSDLRTPSSVAGYCADLSDHGGGWRAPSINEIASLYTLAAGPGIDATAFPQTAAIDQPRMASSTQDPTTPTLVIPLYFFLVNLGGINEETDAPATSTQDVRVYAQCVR